MVMLDIKGQYSSFLDTSVEKDIVLSWKNHTRIHKTSLSMRSSTTVLATLLLSSSTLASVRPRTAAPHEIMGLEARAIYLCGTGDCRGLTDKLCKARTRSLGVTETDVNGSEGFIGMYIEPICQCKSMRQIHSPGIGRALKPFSAATSGARTLLPALPAGSGTNPYVSTETWVQSSGTAVSRVYFCHFIRNFLLILSRDLAINNLTLECELYGRGGLCWTENGK